MIGELLGRSLRPVRLYLFTTLALMVAGVLVWMWAVLEDCRPVQVPVMRRCSASARSSVAIGAQAQAGASESQRLNLSGSAADRRLRVSSHIRAQSAASRSSLDGFDRLRATKPGNTLRPVA